MPPLVYQSPFAASTVPFSMANTADDYSKAHPDLKKLHPRTDGKTVQVSLPLNGTSLALGFQEYTDPTLPADELRTLVLLPGLPGSRFFTHPSIKKQGSLTGFRIVVMERPGVGLSDPWPKVLTDVAAFAPVFEAFCDALQLREVFVVGYSAGTPYALAVAARCRPGLVKAVAVVSSLAPPFPSIGRGMALFFRFGYWACTSWPWFVGWVVRGEGREGRRKPLASMRKSFSAYASTSGDKASLAKPETEALFLESYLELLSRFQEETMLQENLRVARPWGFELSEAGKVPVAVWQGEQDVGCTKGMAEYIAKHVPKCRCTVAPGKGHMLWFEDDVLQDVVTWLRSHTT